MSSEGPKYFGNMGEQIENDFQRQKNVNLSELLIRKETYILSHYILCTLYKKYHTPNTLVEQLSNKFCHSLYDKSTKFSVEIE